MKKPSEIFKNLTAHDHFLVYLIILSLLKITNVILVDSQVAGFQFIKLGIALFAISSLIFLVFKYGLDRRKKYQHVVISTFIILLVLSHADLNPVVFAIGLTTLIALFIPALGIPPLDWSGIDIRFSIFGTALPLSLIFITLSLIFNVDRIRKHPLAIKFHCLIYLIGFYD